MDQADDTRYPLRGRHMTLSGRIFNGQLVLDEAVVIEEGTALTVDVREDAVTPLPVSRPLTVWDGLRELVGTAELPADFAAEHDHYIHGTPRRKPL